MHCRNDGCLCGVTTLNKVMYNFTSAARGLRGKECSEKVSIPGLKVPALPPPAWILKLIAKFCVGMCGQMEGLRTLGLPLDRLSKNCGNLSSAAMKIFF